MTGQRQQNLINQQAPCCQMPVQCTVCTGFPRLLKSFADFDHHDPRYWRAHPDSYMLFSTMTESESEINLRCGSLDSLIIPIAFVLLKFLIFNVSTILFRPKRRKNRENGVKRKKGE